MIPQEFDGFITQHANNDVFTTLDQYLASNVVVDCGGLPLKELHIENGMNSIVENFGLGTELYAPPRVLSDFVKNFYGNKFIQPNTPALTAGVMGQRVEEFESQFGRIKLNYDIFMNNLLPKTTTTPATSPQAPANPTVTGVTPVSSDASGSWASTDAGNYLYAVSATNRYGESGLVVINSGGTAAAIVAGGSADLTFAAATSLYPPTCFTIYRAGKNVSSATGANFYPLFQVSAAAQASGYDGGGSGVVRDRNRWLPNCNSAMLIQQDTEVLSFKQLAPLMKMDLAITSPAYRFAVLLYGTPFLYAPMKMVRIINIGQS
jgi:hypothetical protein